MAEKLTVKSDYIQNLRDSVRPVLTCLMAVSYVVVIIIACWKGALSGKEAVAAIGTPFMMMMSYHFAKSSRKDFPTGQPDS